MLLVLILVALTAVASSDDCPEGRPVQETPWDKRLRLHLYEMYPYDVRPVKNDTHAVVVAAALSVTAFKFNVKEEILIMTSSIALTWTDENLVWNASDFNGISEMNIYNYEIWSPRLSQLSLVTSTYATDYFYSPCTVKSTGEVSCVPHMLHEVLCKTNLTNWPFDTQKCTFRFGATKEDVLKINYTIAPSAVEMTNDVLEGPGWRLAKKVEFESKVTGVCNATYTVLQFDLYFERIAAGPSAIVLVPSIVVSCLTVTSLLLDVNDSTRLGLVSFSLWTHRMLMTRLDSMIPKYGAFPPIILIFLRNSIIVTLFALMFTLLLIKIRCCKKPPQLWVVSVSAFLTRPPLRYVTILHFEESKDKDEARDEVVENWKNLANFLNSLCFIVLVIAYIYLLVSYLPH